MAEHGASCHGARVCEPLLEPDVRILEPFHEEVAKNGLEFLADAAVYLDALIDGLGLCVSDMLAAVAGLEVFRVVALVCG